MVRTLVFQGGVDASHSNSGRQPEESAGPSAHAGQICFALHCHCGAEGMEGAASKIPCKVVSVGLPIITPSLTNI